MTRIPYGLAAIITAAVFAYAPVTVCAEELLQWKECVGEAKDKHPDLVSAREKVNQAKASKEITRSAVIPQLTGNASETTNKTATTVKSTTSSSAAKDNRNTTYDYSITGQELVFDGFKTSFDLSQAERNIYSARYNYDVTSSNIRLRLRTAFVNLLTAQELVRVTEDIEARRNQTYQLVKLRYEGGREHKGSLLKSEADLAQATYGVNLAKRNIYLQQRALIKELGRATFSPIIAKGDLGVGELVRERPDFENMAQTTPLLRQLVAQKEAANFGVKSAYADFFPQVYASGTVGNTNVNAFPDKNEWSVGSSMVWPIFDGGNRFASLSKAKAALGQAEADERSGKDGVIVTLSNTWTALQNGVDNVEVQRKLLEAAGERAKIAEAEYAAGLMTYDNWIIIEDDYVNTKINFLNAETNALQADANWVQAKGGTLDYDEE
ncbi:MAG: TolC family protein [Candidatus Omnitrophica bacterium]|nr:TolC family protein [Candidatus Omnitrophota bacterium]